MQVELNGKSVLAIEKSRMFVDNKSVNTHIKIKWYFKEMRENIFISVEKRKKKHCRMIPLATKTKIESSKFTKIRVDNFDHFLCQGSSPDWWEAATNYTSCAKGM